MEFVKNIINWASGPTVLFTLVTVAFVLSLRFHAGLVEDGTPTSSSR